MRWRSLPLEQVNSDQPGWHFWEQPIDQVKSLRAFLAAEAARDQGEKIFEQFVFALLETVHRDKKPVDAMETIQHAASQVPGLDFERLKNEMDQPQMRERIARDYSEGVDQYGVFGTPTVLFPGGDAVFLKFTPIPRDNAYQLFENVRAISLEEPYVREMKKPRRPEAVG